MATGKPTLIVSTVEIRRPIEEVFRFGSTPGTWPAWHPTATSVSGAVDGPMREGDQILERDRFSFLTGSIRWRARSVTPPNGWIIDGVVDEVPFFRGTTTSIVYVLSTTSTGTRLERQMTYRVPNVVGRFLDWLHFKAHNAHQSQRAVDQMKRLLENSTAGLEPRAGKGSSPQ